MTTARRTTLALATVAALTIVVATAINAHIMFLKLDSFFLEPNSTGTVQLINGDFDLSENVITRDRMLDVSVVGPGGTTHPPESAWTDSAVFHWSPDSVDTAILSFQTGGPGTYLIGVSTAARVITLTGEEFNDYLVHDGLLDTIEERKAAGTTDDGATERYSKHVKAVVQVGGARSGEWATELGYPAEFIPLQNPYELSRGDRLQVRFLRGGEPVARQLVYANYEGYHSHDAAGEHVESVTTRTNADGIATIPLNGTGRWYVRTIHMAETTTEPDVDYESNWATLTFEVR
ncbi:MAG: DUF4198 domain-containing protein [Gemmatimonadetes bacterium]|nr:DUF4198 domain-containing protein [Gemmatimonadota bacterium]MYD15110.1 DUF4198 domain-containing protein [Gemmatimonadota bacterium]MYI64779.1 DUF4198 domain-containing protein [Gemmatimonadota bacterium]